MRRQALRLAGSLVAAFVVLTVIPAVATGASVVDTTEPTASTQQVDSTAAPTDTPAPTDHRIDTHHRTDSVDRDDGARRTSQPPDTSEPTQPTEPAGTSEPPQSTDLTESTIEPDCTPAVDGDGPVVVRPGCELTPPPPAAANPPLLPACGLTVMVVVDASASIDTAAVRSAVVDALVDTGSTLAIAEFSTGANLAVG